MRRWIRPALLCAALSLALAGAAFAQGDLPQPPQGFRPPPAPPPAPVRPYTPVAVKLAGPFGDQSFAAFRQTLAATVQRKDRSGLAKLIVSRDFFWLQDKDIADNSKPGIDNLAKAVGLDDPKGAGWDVLASDAADPTLAEVPQNPGLYCAPAPPAFDPQALQKLFEQTETEPTDWGYSARDGAEVRAAAQTNAPVVDKLGLYFVRVLQDSAPAEDEGPSFLHVALPNGKTGFVAVDDIVPLANDQICYAKEAGAWKIAGYIGGTPQ
jgi:hypothetical protein